MCETGQGDGILQSLLFDLFNDCLNLVQQQLVKLLLIEKD